MCFQEGLDRLRGVAPRVNRDRDDLKLACLRTELLLGGVQVADDQRADVGAVVVDEGDDDRLAAVVPDVHGLADGVPEGQRRRGLDLRRRDAGELGARGPGGVRRRRACAAATAGGEERRRDQRPDQTGGPKEGHRFEADRRRRVTQDGGGGPAARTR